MPVTLSDLLDRFDLLLDTPNAIPQLRQFILQLAVQGRLTEQDPDEEPVEVLLEEMEAEKKRLKEAGDYNYQKKMPPITEGDLTLPTPLPRGWVWVRFGALGKVTGGGTPKKSNPDYWGGTIPWVSPKDMGDTVIRQTQDYITEKGLDGSSAKRIPESSVLIVGRSGILQRTLPVAINAVECTVNQDLKVLTPFNREMARYIQIMLKGFQPHILKHLVKTGTTVESLKYTEFQLQPYPLPPLEEQKRIVETVDRLMDECDALEATQTQMRETQSAATVSATHALRTAPDADTLRNAWDRVATHFDTLTATPDAVDELRQTILQLAVQGRLTEQDPDDEPAEDRVERSKMEIQRLYNDGKITRPSKRPAVQEEEKVFDVPSGWMWTRLGNVLAPVNGRAYKKEELLETGTPVIRIQNLGGGGSWYYSDLELDDKKYCKEGDLLYAWSGTFGPYIWEGPRAIFHYHIWRIELTEALNKRFAYYLLKAISGDIEEGAHGIMLPHMTKGGMEKHVVPLPPLAEQKRIVETVDRLMNVCDQLEEQLEQSEATGEQWAEAALVGAIDRRKIETV